MPDQTPAAGKDLSVLHEALSVYPRFSDSHFAITGFDDMPSAGPLVLGAFVLGGPAAIDVIPRLGLAQSEADEIIATLIDRGYLEHRTRPGEAAPRITITDRGLAVVGELEHGIKVARWRDFAFRPGDIIISAPAKSGTTWVQMICALLIFRDPDLPAPLPVLSPWLENLVNNPRNEIYAQLEAQQHRRFIKTHVRLSEIPIEPQVTYIAVARHPLDMSISMYHQLHNRQRDNPHGGPDLPLYEWLLRRINGRPAHGQWSFLPDLMGQLSDAWSRRHEPNVLLLHYEDLVADLEGEMRRLAARLNLDIADLLWPDLVKAATFGQMRAAADKIQPALTGYLKSNSAFFHSGSVGAGRQLLSAADYALYQDRVAPLASADLLSWLHRQDQSVTSITGQAPSE